MTTATKTAHDWSKWEPNIRCAVWGCGMVDAPHTCPLSRAYCAGNRSEHECEHFGGIETRDVKQPVLWGTTLPGCCWLLVEAGGKLSRKGTEG